MHNRYLDPEYAGVVSSLKSELRKVRQRLGDTDEDNVRIRKIIKEHWDD